MTDFETLITTLRNFGHTVDRAIEVPSNAGEAEFTVDGRVLTLAEVRELITADEAK